VAANFLIDGHDPLRTFQEQSLAVKLGAFLGLSAFVAAMVFSSYLLLISMRSNSIQSALAWLPWPPKNEGPSTAAFRATCGACAAAFLFFSFLFLRIILE
jgi:hypothetical protein